MFITSTLQLSQVQESIQAWKEKLKTFQAYLEKMESSMKEKVSSINSLATFIATKQELADIYGEYPY